MTTFRRQFLATIKGHIMRKWTKKQIEKVFNRMLRGENNYAPWENEIRLWLLERYVQITEERPKILQPMLCDLRLNLETIDTMIKNCQNIMETEKEQDKSILKRNLWTLNALNDKGMGLLKEIESHCLRIRFKDLM